MSTNLISGQISGTCQKQVNKHLFLKLKKIILAIYVPEAWPDICYQNNNWCTLLLEPQKFLKCYNSMWSKNRCVNKFESKSLNNVDALQKMMLIQIWNWYHIKVHLNTHTRYTPTQLWVMNRGSFVFYKYLFILLWVMWLASGYLI